MILALAGLKGGTGKTTLAVSLAVTAAERGRRVLVVDADPRGDTSVWASLAGPFAPPSVALPSCAGSAQLRALALGLDLCVVDCPSGDPARLAVVLDAADFCLVPCGPSALDVWALGPSFDVVREARAHNPCLAAAVLINRTNPATTLARVVAGQLTRHGFPVLGTSVRQRVALVEAVGSGMSISRALPESDSALEIGAVLDELEALRRTQDAAAHPLQ